MDVFALGSHLRFRNRMTQAAALAAILSFGATVTPTLRAATNDGDDVPASDAAPASRAVRLSSVDGQAQVLQGGQVIADPATVNLPIFEGMQIITANDGRVEVQFEDGSVARLSPNSTLTVTKLQPQSGGGQVEVTLNGGLGYFELQPSTQASSFRVGFGTASFSASSFSVIRVDLDSAPGQIAVFSGNVHLERGDALQVDVHGGQNLSLDAQDAGHYNLAETIEPDSWDNWNADRDQILNSEASQRTAATGDYATNQTPGMSDLDANGNWYNVPGEGYVWSPYEAISAGSSWDPYGYGNWVYYPRYGYVFVSGYGWGYTPFSCGLWNYYDSFGWGWAPGGVCRTWWGGGGGWGYNIGNYPRWYRVPRRPPVGPVRPHPGGPRGPIHIASIPVDRRPVKTLNAAGAGGVRGFGGPRQPVTIAGHTVEPLRPVAPRGGYDRPSNTVLSRNGAGGAPSSPVYGNGRVGMPNYPVSGYRPSPSMPARGSDSGSSLGQRPNAPSAPRPYSPSSPRPYSPSAPSRPSAPAPMRPSAGGMGGGGGHPSAPSMPSAPHGGGGGAPAPSHK